MNRLLLSALATTALSLETQDINSISELELRKEYMKFVATHGRSYAT